MDLPMAEMVASNRWVGRPWVARTIRVVIFVAPIALAIAAVVIVGRLIPRPSGSIQTAGWWLALTILSTAVLWSADRALRRLLPIAALFRLSLVFPDRAPSRFTSALRAGTVRQLQRRLATGANKATTPQEAAEQLVTLASALNAHDRLTRGHTERVRAYSVMIGEELGLDQADLELLNWSGLVHDIGKLAVPTEILNKPGKPTEEEWGILKDHPARADRLVAPLRPWLGDWAESATQHHERFDGAGYPKALAGHDITLAGRIVAVADADDVMTSARSYKKPMPAEDARRELAVNAGTQFDPVVVRAFLNIALGRLRLVMGPLTSLLQFPAGGASLGSTAATGVGALASVAIAAVVGLGSVPPQQEVAADPEPLPDVAEFRVAEVEDSVVYLEEDGSGAIDLTRRLSGEVDSIAIIDQPTEGSAELDGTVVRFTPANDWHGTAEIEVRVCFVDWGCEVAIVEFVTAPTNDPPTPWADRATTPEDSPLTVDVVANDVDIDGDQLALLAVTVLDPDDDTADDTTGADLGPDDIEVAMVDGRVLVTPGPNRWGSARIGYELFDGTISAPGRLTVGITPVNDAPVAVDDVVVAYENTTTEFDVLINDVDVDGDDLRIVSIEGVTGGTAVADGATVTFVPDVRHVGQAGLRYTITDGELTASAELDIEVRAISERTVLADDAAAGLEDQAVIIDATANDPVVGTTVLTGAGSGAQLDLATLSIVAHPNNGTVAWDGAVFRYTPTADWWGEDRFRYAVCDTDLFCNQADVTVTVAAVNDRPSTNIGPAVLVAEDAGVVTVPGWATSTSAGPANELGQALSFAVSVDVPSLFAATPTVDAATGDLSFTPAADANGTATMTVVLSDDGGTADGGVDATTAVSRTITVSPVNDRPSFAVGAPVAVVEDSGTVTMPGWASSLSTGPGNESGQTLSFVVLVDDASLFAVVPSIDAVSGDLSFVLAADSNGAATMTITATDDGGTASGGVDTSAVVSRAITVSAANDPPVATDDAPTLSEDQVGGLTFGVLGDDTDIDGDTLTYSSADTSTVVEGTITDHLDGTFTYVPHEHFNGTETFTYVVSDGNGGTDTGLVTITVNPMADLPVAVDDSRITPVDTPLVVAAPGLLTNDFDVDGETITVTGAGAPGNGAVSTNPDGSYTYTPGGGFVGTDTFTYTVQDSSGATDTATVTVTVDSGVSSDTYFFGDSGSSASNYDLVASAPVSSIPVFDSDADGNPGLSIDKEKDESETDPDKFQLWTLATATPLALDGPVTLNLWSAFDGFATGETGHPYIWLYDCASGGVSCTTLASTDVHTDDWDQGIADFVEWQLDLGSVTHTVAGGRELVLRLQFDHEDMWVAMTADYPTALDLTLANVAPTATDDAATVTEDSGTTNLTVLANDVDADLDTTSVTITTPAAAGTATTLGDGTIDYTPDPDANGGDSFAYQVCDLGGLCDTATVLITVTAVNDQPSFTGGLASITGGLGPNTMPGWATAISAGPADESGQILTFTVTANDNPGMFSAAPVIDVNTGDMTFTASGSGAANLTVELTDDGGTANGGDDTSTSYSFTITVP